MRTILVSMIALLTSANIVAAEITGNFPSSAVKEFPTRFTSYYSKLFPKESAVVVDFQCQKADGNASLCITDDRSVTMTLVGDSQDPNTMPADGAVIKGIVVKANNLMFFQDAMRQALVVELMLRGNPEEVIEGKVPWDKSFYSEGLQIGSTGQPYQKTHLTYRVDIAQFEPGIISIVFTPPAK